MTKNCSQCSAQFDITDDDLKFYDKISPVFQGEKYQIPPPTLCPECRHQRRQGFVNMRHLYKNTCAATREKVVSIFSPDKPLTIFNSQYWWGDEWDPLEYGREFDFSRPFFEQFRQLLQDVPTMSLVVAANENSEYVNYAGWDKNCYLCFCTDHSEDCMYTQDLFQCKNTLDSVHSYNLELCYECTDCNDCYNVRHSQNALNCSDSSYLFDCQGCKNCFLSVGLRQQQYCILNQQYTPDEYEKKVEYILANFDEFQSQFQQLLLSHPRKAEIGTNNEHVSGNYLYNSKNSQECFDCSKIEDSKYCQNMKGGGRDFYDVTRWGNNAELMYECCGAGEGASNILFCTYCWGGIRNLLYCHLCISSQNCFGCVGLRKKQYCIFNVQYTKEEYEQLVPKIINHMKQTKEWGEFIPVQHSLFAYNETVAHEFSPLTQQETLEKGWQWKEKEEPDFSNITKKIPAEKLPNTIQEIPDDILNWVIICEESKRPFKIQKSELEFYRKMNLPIPRLHPDIRHQKRMALRNPRKLWERNCQNCEKRIQTTYSPERSETVYCEECYLQEVY